jgi:hypothetical protein
MKKPTLLILLIAVCNLLCSCGYEIYAGGRRIDKYEAKQVQVDRGPVKCIFFNCDEGKGS